MRRKVVLMIFSIAIVGVFTSQTRIKELWVGYDKVIGKAEFECFKVTGDTAYFTTYLNLPVVDTAKFAFKADTSTYAVDAGTASYAVSSATATYSDTADYAVISDTSNWAIFSDSANYVKYPPPVDTANWAWRADTAN